MTSYVSCVLSRVSFYLVYVVLDFSFMFSLDVCVLCFKKEWLFNEGIKSMSFLNAVLFFMWCSSLISLIIHLDSCQFRKFMNQTLPIKFVDSLQVNDNCRMNWIELLVSVATTFFIILINGDIRHLSKQKLLLYRNYTSALHSIFWRFF